MKKKDEAYFEKKRLNMVDTQLQARGIRNEAVLEAMTRVPRHRFVPEKYRDRAYADTPLGIGCDQTISQPYMVALMTEALSLTPESRVLEIGTGSGYQAAVLAELAAEVYTVERHAELSEQAAETLSLLGYKNVQTTVGDGTLGWPEHAPYDGIIVTAGAPDVPESLKNQLADGGRLVVPVGTRPLQRCVCVRRRGNKFKSKDLVSCVFVPLLGAEGWSPDSSANDWL